MRRGPGRFKWYLNRASRKQICHAYETISRPLIIDTYLTTTAACGHTRKVFDRKERPRGHRLCKKCLAKIIPVEHQTTKSKK